MPRRSRAFRIGDSQSLKCKGASELTSRPEPPSVYRQKLSVAIQRTKRTVNRHGRPRRAALSGSQAKGPALPGDTYFAARASLLSASAQAAATSRFGSLVLPGIVAQPPFPM